MKFSRFVNFLKEPSKRYVVEDQHVRLQIDQQIMLRKKAFLDVVNDIQAEMIQAANLIETKRGLNFELGAGVLPMNANYGNVLSTDVVPSSHLDGILDATNLDLVDQSTQTLFLQNTFHHIPDPQAFFSEAQRVLTKGGRIIIVDPYDNFLSGLIYPRLFVTENYNKAGSWNDASDHAMIGANQALTHIVFKRDLQLFLDSNPGLRLVDARPLRSGFRYLLTGGLNFRQLLPKSLLDIIRALERYRIIPNILAIHWVVVLEKL